MATTSRLVDPRPRASFDVVCAGEPIWKTLTVLVSEGGYQEGAQRTAAICAKLARPRR